MSRHLRIEFWNLNGFNSSILGSKLKTSDFLSIINKHDIFALVETHATYETEMNISKFKHFIISVGINRETDFPGDYPYLLYTHSVILVI